MAKTPSVKWTRDDTLIALNLYAKLKFGQFDGKNPIIKEIAAKMGRGSNSLAMKLCNFASLDPVERARGIKGLEGVSDQDRKMWNEFQARPSNLVLQSEQLLHDLFTEDDMLELDFLQGDRVHLVMSTDPVEILATGKVHHGRQFFRQAILTSYGIRCCISDINVPRLLVATYVKPWAKFPDERLNLRNGLCLSSLHHDAFNAGLITLDEKLRVVLSKRLQKFFPQPALVQNFAPFAGKPIHLPEKFTELDVELLNYHRKVIFDQAEPLAA